MKFTVVDADLFLAETAPVTVQDSGKQSQHLVTEELES